MIYSFQILFSITSIVFATEEHFKSAFFIVKENKRSTDQTIKTVGSSSLMTCSQARMRHSWCTFTNFNLRAIKEIVN